MPVALACSNEILLLVFQFVLSGSNSNQQWCNMIKVCKVFYKVGFNKSVLKLLTFTSVYQPRFNDNSFIEKNQRFFAWLTSAPQITGTYRDIPHASKFVGHIIFQHAKRQKMPTYSMLSEVHSQLCRSHPFLDHLPHRCVGEITFDSFYIDCPMYFAACSAVRLKHCSILCPLASQHLTALTHNQGMQLGSMLQVSNVEQLHFVNSKFLCGKNQCNVKYLADRLFSSQHFTNILQTVEFSKINLVELSNLVLVTTALQQGNLTTFVVSDCTICCPPEHEKSSTYLCAFFQNVSSLRSLQRLEIFDLFFDTYFDVPIKPNFIDWAWVKLITNLPLGLVQLHLGNFDYVPSLLVNESSDTENFIQSLNLQPVSHTENRCYTDQTSSNLSLDTCENQENKSTLDQILPLSLENLKLGGLFDAQRSCFDTNVLVQNTMKMCSSLKNCEITGVSVSQLLEFHHGNVSPSSSVFACNPNQTYHCASLHSFVLKTSDAGANIKNAEDLFGQSKTTEMPRDWFNSTFSQSCFHGLVSLTLAFDGVMDCSVQGPFGTMPNLTTLCLDNICLDDQNIFELANNDAIAPFLKDISFNFDTSHSVLTLRILQNNYVGNFVNLEKIRLPSQFAVSDICLANGRAIPVTFQCF